MYHPETSDANEKSCEAFEDEDPNALLSIILSLRAYTYHAQPGFPPMPSIFAIAAASSPPNEPATAAAEKKIADLMPNSLLLYQQLK